MIPGVTTLDALEAMMLGPDERSFRVGLVLPFSGLLGLSGPSALEASMLAAQEINARRWFSDRTVELVLIDSGAAPTAVAQVVSDLADSGAAQGFIGVHTSVTLERVEEALGGRCPYLFASGHDGVQRLPGFYCPGESPEDLKPGLAHVMRERQVTEWAMIGTDYVWPWAMRDAAREVITANAGQVVIDRLLPLGAVKAGIHKVLDDILQTGARGVVLNMPGRDQATALAAIRRRGLDRALVRFSGCLEENTLYAIGGDRSGNLYSTMHSFQSLPSPRRQELNERQRAAFGEDSPVFNSWAEHCYDGVHFLATLEQSGLLRVAPAPPAPHDVHPVDHPEAMPTYQPHLAVAEGLSFSVF